MAKREDKLPGPGKEYRTPGEKTEGLAEEALKLVAGGTGSSAVSESDPLYLMFKSDIDYLYQLIVAAPAPSAKGVYAREDLETQCRYLQAVFSPDKEILQMAYDFLGEAESKLGDLYGADRANENKLSLLFSRMRKNAELIIANL